MVPQRLGNVRGPHHLNKQNCSKSAILNRLGRGLHLYQPADSAVVSTGTPASNVCGLTQLCSAAAISFPKRYVYRIGRVMATACGIVNAKGLRSHVILAARH